MYLSNCDGSTEEYDWGWIFYVQAFGPDKESNEDARNYYSAFLVDRKYGVILPASINGLIFTISRFETYIAEKDKQLEAPQ